MGIPSYFRILVQSHKGILQKGRSPIDCLYLDANSIIYDVVRRLEAAGLSQLSDEVVIDGTIDAIAAYKNDLRPQHTMYVAFDGVAPLAKMGQQRERRWKGKFEASLLSTTKGSEWDTAKITPGTHFMNALGTAARQRLENASTIVSPSSEAGEGEHKIFERIRSIDHSTQAVAIYGLDADLIMLSLLHDRLCGSLSLYRETPHFIKSFDSSLEPNATYRIQIRSFIGALLSDIGSPKLTSDTVIKDYVLACFLLGNDFLPHFPGLNIRGKGMQTLLRCYKKVQTHAGSLTSKNEIQWRNVRLLVTYLAEEESMRLVRHRSRRPRLVGEREVLDAMPVLDTRLQDGIMVGEPDWQRRYYEVLLESEPTTSFIQNICREYCDGLQWTFKYYTEGCIAWTWAFDYPYPPLLAHLSEHVPYLGYDTSFVDDPPLDPLVQLCFVLPPASQYLLPPSMAEEMQKLGTHKVHRVVWAFCSYFWESHVVFAHSPLGQIRALVDEHRKA